MSEIINTWHLDTGDGVLVFDDFEFMLEHLKVEVESCINFLGDEMKITVRKGEMQQSDYEALSEADDL